MESNSNISWLHFCSEASHGQCLVSSGLDLQNIFSSSYKNSTDGGKMILFFSAGLICNVVSDLITDMV